MKPKVYYTTYFNSSPKNGYKHWEIEVYLYTPYISEDQREGGFFRKWGTRFPSFTLTGQSDDERGHFLKATYAWKIELRDWLSEETYRTLRAFVGLQGIRGMVKALRKLNAQRVEYMTPEGSDRCRYIPWNLRKKAAAYTNAIDAKLFVKAA
jgi:hypothetical protein